MKVKEKTQALLMQLAALLLVAVFSLILYSRAEAAQPQVAAGGLHTVGLKSDGTVVAVGGNGDGQINVAAWSDITQVAAGYPHTVGLKSDGTVVAVGNNGYGQINVGAWTGITGVAAGASQTVGLKSDGTVVAVGNNGDGQINVAAWSDITQVAAGTYHTVGLKSDGTVVAVGGNTYGQLDVGAWSDITQVAAGYPHTVGLKSDGTVVAVGGNTSGQLDVGTWTGITGVAAGAYHTVGLKSDGTVVAVGYNGDGQLDVGAWTDITQVAAGRYNTVGLKSDGTVVAVGSNEYGQCDTSDWDLNEAFEGTIGTQVTLTGSDFGTKKGKVRVGGKTCKVSEWGAQSITCEIKAALPPMAYDVVVKPKEPKGVAPIIYEKAFTMMAPEITSVVPGAGAEGTVVTISGSFFSTKKGKVYLEYEKNGQPKKKNCKVTSWGMDSITFVVPKGLVSGSTYPLKVENKVGIAGAPSDFTIE